MSGRDLRTPILPFAPAAARAARPADPDVTPSRIPGTRDVGVSGLSRLPPPVDSAPPEDPAARVHDPAVTSPSRVTGGAAAPSPAGTRPSVSAGPTPGSGQWSLSPVAQMQLCLEVEVIAESLYKARLLQTSTDPTVLGVPFNTLSPKLRAIYREAAEVAIRRMDPFVFAGALVNARRVAPQFEAALEVYHHTLTLSPRSDASSPPTPLPVPADASPAHLLDPFSHPSAPESRS